MSLSNFSLPYQSATPVPFFYGGNGNGNANGNGNGHGHGHGDGNGNGNGNGNGDVGLTGTGLRFNALLPPAPAVNLNEPDPFRNEPYVPPARYQPHQQSYQQSYQHHRRQNGHRGQDVATYVEHSSFSSTQDTRYVNYEQDFRRTQPRQSAQHHQQHQQMRPPPPPPPPPASDPAEQQRALPDRQHARQPVKTHRSRPAEQESYPERPNGYTRVNGGGGGYGPGTKTSVHAVLDYDDDFEDYYDEDDRNIPKDAHVTPIQGPIFLKNGTVPVVPLYSYPQLNNGTFVQIPILWTALSVALGVESRGDLVRGAPCIKKYHQLFCPTAGNTYPIERIERFIDENKALMKRMYGDFEMNPGSREPAHRTRRKRRRSGSGSGIESGGEDDDEDDDEDEDDGEGGDGGAGEERSFEDHDIPDGGPSLGQGNVHVEQESDGEFDGEFDGGESFFGGHGKTRSARQSFGKNRNNESGRVDACESKVEIVTPYWASNSAGKIRAIVNTQHFEQAIHQEVCSKTRTNRCSGDCGCEQKYKWHRLLAYDPDNDCKGIFMDWFLFPSCCVCRCDPVVSSNAAGKFSSAGGAAASRS